MWCERVDRRLIGFDPADGVSVLPIRGSLKHCTSFPFRTTLSLSREVPASAEDSAIIGSPPPASPWSLQVWSLADNDLINQNAGTGCDRELCIEQGCIESILVTSTITYTSQAEANGKRGDFCSDHYLVTAYSLSDGSLLIMSCAPRTEFCATE